MKLYIFLIFLIVVSCSTDSAKTNKNVAKSEKLYCPITTFYLGWDRAANHIAHLFEAAPTPCENEVFEKGSLFAIDKKGCGVVNFEGNEIKLNSSKATFQKGTLLWSQTFRNDSLNIKFYLENYEVISKGHHYYYKSKLSLNIKDSLYQYDMKGWCDSIAVSKLLKE